MGEMYLAPDGKWKPVATVTGAGGPPLLVDISKGNGMSGTALFSVGDDIWDHVSLYTGGTTAAYAFRLLREITYVPSINTGNVTSMAYMFASCAKLTTAPNMDTSTVRSMVSMFESCASLTTVPNYDTSAVADMSRMFSGCDALRVAPAMDTSNVTNMNFMFSMNRALTSVPAYDTRKVTTMTNMFATCSTLAEIPALDMSGITSTSGANITGSSTMKSLTSFKAYGSRYGFTVANTDLGADALNELFSNLGTPVGAQTITITGTPGAATCNRSIATNKGWTVVG